ncbi:MAG: 3-phosphoglycerate dehydrogenase family protein [Nitrospirota bacterium]|jgi:D-3-phosphoglycerate dehydrogenase
MYKVLLLNNISPVGLERFPRGRYECASEFQHPDAILVRSANMHEMEIPTTVKAIGRAGAGTNNIPVAAMTERGVPVFNAPGANANAVKELVLCGLLLASRDVVQGWEFVRGLQGDDREVGRLVETNKKRFAGNELTGYTLGVVGLGAIGRAVCHAALDLGMKVVGLDPELTVQGAWRLPHQVEQAVNVEDLFRRSDYITFHVPLVDATRHMVNDGTLTVMKDGVRLLNFSRGGIVDEAAVGRGIEAGKVRCYVTDFPSAQLKDHDRVIALPHLGASTRQAEENCAAMVVDQVREYLENGNVVNAVNLPTCHLPRDGKQRLTVVNADVPQMVSQITFHLADAGLNIHEMLNKSRSGIAYTVIDVDGVIPDSVVQGVSAIEGVRTARAIN